MLRSTMLRRSRCNTGKAFFCSDTFSILGAARLENQAPSLSRNEAGASRLNHLSSYQLSRIVPPNIGRYSFKSHLAELACSRNSS